MGLFSGASTLIGLDVGASSIKIVKGTMGRSAFTVEKFVAVPLAYRAIDERGIANMEAVTNAIKTAIAELGDKSPKVAAAMGGAGVLTKRIVIPKIPKKEIPDQVRWEAEQVFPQDVTTVLIDHMILGDGAQVPGAPDGTKGWDLMLVGVRQEEAKGLRDAIENSNAGLKVLDIDSFVVGDFLESLVEVPKEGALGFVDIGASGTRVYVRHGKNIVFIREFVIGGNTFTEAIAQALGVSFEDAETLKIQNESGMPQEAQAALQGVAQNWKSELQQCEDIFVTQNANTLVARWYVFGGAVRTPGLLDAVRNDRFADKVVPLPTHEFIKAKDKKIDPQLLAAWSSRLVTAAGLGCRKV